MAQHAVLPVPHTTRLLVVSCIFVPLIFASTSLRLWVRGRARWSTDDALVVACIPFLILELVAFWRLPVLDSAPGTTKITLWYLAVISELMQIWLARLAMIYSAIRITPDFSIRRTLHFVATLLVLGLLIQIAQVLWDCEAPKPDWNNNPHPICFFRLEVPIVQFVFSIIADILLIYFPLRALHLLTSAPVLRRRLQYIFCATIIATITSLVRFIIFLTLQGTVYQYVISIIEPWIDLLVCNLPVTAIYLIHILGFSNGLEPPKSSTSPSDPEMNKPQSDLRFAAPTRHSMDMPTISIGDAQFGVVSIQFVGSQRSGVGEMTTIKSMSIDDGYDGSLLEVRDVKWGAQSLTRKEGGQWTTSIGEEMEESEEDGVPTIGTTAPTT